MNKLNSSDKIVIIGINIKFLIFLSLLSIIFGASYLIKDNITPFAVAFILAYLLNPLTNNLTKLYIKRNYAVLIVIFIFYILLTLICLYLLPKIYNQITDLIQKIPQYKHYVTDNLIPLISQKIEHIEPGSGEKLKIILQNYITQMFSVTYLIVSNVFQYALATINILSLFLLVPFFLFFFLKDWQDNMLSLESLVPENYKIKVNDFFKDIDFLLSSYIRGQFYVCMIMVTYYYICLSLLGLDFSLIISIIAGFLVIVPIFGYLISLSLCLTMVYFQFGIDYHLIYVLIIQFTAQGTESFFLTPFIIGNKIGINPVFALFSLFICGNLFGMWGVLFAMPLGGIIRIILKYLVEYYKSSVISEV